MATRLYLTNGSGFDPNITPGFDAGWQESGSAVRRLMVPYLLSDALTTTAVGTTTPGNTTLHRQYVSPPMESGNAITTGSTFEAQIMGLESAVNDNIINRVRCVKVISRDGGTVRATLIAIGNATSVVEWNTSLRNLRFFNTTASAANYTTVAGDRLLAEFGSDDSAGASISGSMRWGADASGTGDLGLNETDTTTTLRPWLEISNNIVWEARPQRRDHSNRVLVAVSGSRW